MREIIAVWLSGSSLAVLVFAVALIVRTFNWVARVDRKLDVLLKRSGVDHSQLGH